MYQKCSDLNMRLDITYLCAISDSSRNKAQNWHHFILTLFTVLKTMTKYEHVIYMM